MELFPACRPVIEHDKLIFNREELEGLANESRTIMDIADPERPINFAPKDSKEGVDEETLIGDDMDSEEELIPDRDNVSMGDLFPISPESMDEEGDIQME
ncbi:unnamed protein product [Symbiodinium sp. KB8]|nr:unnamed protein product [Symbiodinium sp. KB8]